MKLRLELRLSQKLIMTPQLQQAIKLLQLSRLELIQTLSQHLEENPLLEELQAEAEEEEEAAAAHELEPEVQTTSSASQTDGAGETNEEGAESPEELSASSWEDYFDSDRRVGDTEYPSGLQDEYPSYDQTLTKPVSLDRSVCRAR